MGTSTALEDAWIEYACGVDINPFPRDVGRWTPTRTYVDEKGKRKWIKAGYPRFQVETELDYLEAIERYRRRGVTAGIHSRYMVDNHYRSKIFIEVGDNSPIQVAHRQMQALCKTLHVCYDVAPTVLFSGGKSFHIYIPFHPLELRSTIYNVVDEVLRDILRQGVEAGFIPHEESWVKIGSRIIKVKTPKADIDWKVAIDINRTARLPYTYHIKSVMSGQPRQAVPIGWRWSLHKILRESRECMYRHEFRMDGSAGREVRRLLRNTDEVLYSIEKREAEEEAEEPIYIRSPRAYIYGGGRHIYKGRRAYIYRRRVAWLLAIAPRIRDGRHRITYHLLVPYLRHAGYIYRDAEAIYIRFIRRTGERPERYLPFFRYLWDRRDARGEPYKPMKLERFLEEYPDLAKYLPVETFKRHEGNKLKNA